MISHMHIYIYIFREQVLIFLPEVGRYSISVYDFYSQVGNSRIRSPSPGRDFMGCLLDLWRCFSTGIFWVSPCFWICSSWLMAWPWANQQWLPVFSSWWTWFFWECVLYEKSVTFKFTKSWGSTIKRGKDTYFFPQANNLKFADRHLKCDLNM